MTLVLDGRMQSNRADARRLIYVDGRERWLQQKVYGYLVVLARWRPVGDGRVSGNMLPGHTSERRAGVMFKLGEQSGLPVSYAEGGYRLEVEPKNITTQREGK